MHFYPRSPCGERQLAIYNQLLIQNISIHALLAESDGQYPVTAMMCKIFLSTLSLRRATFTTLRCMSLAKRYFYPRSPCGERPPITLRHCTTYLFLSTLSLRRATSRIPLHCLAMTNFYPRSPCGERQINGSLSPAHQHISIHALLAESDARFKRERKGMIAFLSTLSLRRATACHL